MKHYRRVVTLVLEREFKIGDVIQIEMLDESDRKRVIEVSAERNGLMVPVEMNDAAKWTETAELIQTPSEAARDRWKAMSADVDARLDAITPGRAS